MSASGTYPGQLREPVACRCGRLWPEPYLHRVPEGDDLVTVCPICADVLLPKRGRTPEAKRMIEEGKVWDDIVAAAYIDGTIGGIGDGVNGGHR